MKKFKEFCNEMAQDIGDSDQAMTKFIGFRQDNYAASKKCPIIKSIVDLPDGINLHKRISNIGNTFYYTNDHTKKENIHKSKISTVKASKDFPYDHEEQKLVEKDKNSNLPKNYSQDIIYHHFLNSKYPLKSSITQYTDGHKMWRKLSHRALADGHHVYYHDGKKLHKTNKNNIENHLDSYFGDLHDDSPEIPYKKRHMILSKKELK